MVSQSQKQLHFMEGFFTSDARMTGVLPRMRLNIKKKRLFIGTCLTCFSSNSRIPAIRMDSSTSVFNTSVFTT